jgi:hypothetical protein
MVGRKHLRNVSQVLPDCTLRCSRMRTHHSENPESQRSHYFLHRVETVPKSWCVKRLPQSWGPFSYFLASEGERESIPRCLGGPLPLLAVPAQRPNSASTQFGTDCLTVWKCCSRAGGHFTCSSRCRNFSPTYSALQDIKTLRM